MTLQPLPCSASPYVVRSRPKALVGFKPESSRQITTSEIHVTQLWNMGGNWCVTLVSYLVCAYYVCVSMCIVCMFAYYLQKSCHMFVMCCSICTWGLSFWDYGYSVSLRNLLIGQKPPKMLAKYCGAAPCCKWMNRSSGHNFRRGQRYMKKAKSNL